MDEYWIGAAFIPVVKGAYFYDLNNNGNLEIAVVVSHGGSAVWNTPAMLFTVQDKGLKILKKQQVNDEFSEYVYTSKEDYENPAYKCSSCIEKKYYYADGRKAVLSNRKH